MTDAITVEPQDSLRIYVDGITRYAYSAELAFYIVSLYEELAGDATLNDEYIQIVANYIKDNHDANITYDDVYRIISTEC